MFSRRKAVLGNQAATKDVHSEDPNSGEIFVGKIVRDWNVEEEGRPFYIWQAKSKLPKTSFPTYLSHTAVKTQDACEHPASGLAEFREAH